MSNLLDELQKAIATCTGVEERGGVILYHPEKDLYEFVEVRNANAGTETAKVLWTGDREEHAKKVIARFREGWRQHGSFHTHPEFPAHPSGIDMSQLFPGFKVNYIYSISDQELVRFTWLNETTIKAQLIMKNNQIFHDPDIPEEG